LIVAPTAGGHSLAVSAPVHGPEMAPDGVALPTGRNSSLFCVGPTLASGRRTARALRVHSRRRQEVFPGGLLTADPSPVDAGFSGMILGPNSA